MPRRKIRESDLGDVLAALEGSGVDRYDIRDAGVEGWVTLLWDDPEAPRKAEDGLPEKLFRWSMILVLLIFVLGIFFLAFLFDGLIPTFIGWAGGG